MRKGRPLLPQPRATRRTVVGGCGTQKKILFNRVFAQAPLSQHPFFAPKNDLFSKRKKLSPAAPLLLHFMLGDVKKNTRGNRTTPIFLLPLFHLGSEYQPIRHPKNTGGAEFRTPKEGHLRRPKGPLENKQGCGPKRAWATLTTHYIIITY